MDTGPGLQGGWGRPAGPIYMHQPWPQGPGQPWIIQAEGQDRQLPQHPSLLSLSKPTQLVREKTKAWAGRPLGLRQDMKEVTIPRPQT